MPPDVPVLLDCKRADVPNTMAAYACGVFDAMEFDAATVHAYHGADSLAAFARYGTRGVYVVYHTSSPGRADLQHLPSGDAPLFMAVARLAVRSNDAGNIGVVGRAGGALSTDTVPTAARGFVTIDTEGSKDGSDPVEMKHYLRTIGPWAGPPVEVTFAAPHGTD